MCTWLLARRLEVEVDTSCMNHEVENFCVAATRGDSADVCLLEGWSSDLAIVEGGLTLLVEHRPSAEGEQSETDCYAICS